MLRAFPEGEIEIFDPQAGFSPDKVVQSIVENVVRFRLRIEYGVAVGRGHGAAQYPGGVRAPGRSVEEFGQGVALDIHSSGKDGIRILDFVVQVSLTRRLHIEIDQVEFPLFFGHQGGKGQQSQRRKGGFAADVLHDILEAPERIGGKRGGD